MKQHKKIERLMLFSGVAEELNFGRAAEKLGISRGYLSEQIKQLEAELGAKLLYRSTRNVSLTSEGKQVLASLETIQNTVTHMEKSLRQDQTELQGEIAITAPHLFANNVLTDICYAFNQQHPNVHFSLDTGYQRHDLNRGHLDLAFRSTNNPPQDMVARVLMSYRHCLLASPAYLQQHGQPNTINEITEHSCLCGPDQDSWQLGHKKIAISGWLKLNDNLALMQQLLAGRGIARLPDYVIKQAIRQKQLVPILADANYSEHKIYIIHPPKLRQTRRVSAFIDFVKAEVEKNWSDNTVQIP